MEAAVIEFLQLAGSGAKRLRGRSKVKLINQARDALSLDKAEEKDNEDLHTKAEWLKKSAGTHTLLGNKLSNIAKRMKANERHKEDRKGYDDNVLINKNTMPD